MNNILEKCKAVRELVQAAYYDRDKLDEAKASLDTLIAEQEKGENSFLDEGFLDEGPWATLKDIWPGGEAEVEAFNNGTWNAEDWRTPSQQQPASALVEALSAACVMSYQNFPVIRLDKALTIVCQHTREPDVAQSKPKPDMEYVSQMLEKHASTADMFQPDAEVIETRWVKIFGPFMQLDVEAGARALYNFQHGGKLEYAVESIQEDYRKRAKACYLASGWTVKE